MKIYTRRGDDGTTGLMGGQRIRKDDRRIECYGTVDELNSFIGVASVGADAQITAALRQIQNDLFVIGSHLATPPESASAAHLPALDEEGIGRLEMQIDSAEAQLPAIRQFILPGGSETVVRLHQARTVCRRAERRVVAFAQDRPVSAIIITYLNRLSDWLFVHARLANKLAGVGDVPWEKK